MPMVLSTRPWIRSRRPRRSPLIRVIRGIFLPFFLGFITSAFMVHGLSIWVSIYGLEYFW